MVFATQDLLVDPPIADLDLVTCRNLLIYLERDAIARILFLLHSALRVGGYLFLGKGEPLSPQQQGFEAVSSRWHIYRKTGATSDIKVRFPRRLQSPQHATAVPARAHRAAIENFNLPSVLVDGEFRILRVYGDTTDFLRVPAGKPTDSLLDLAQRDLAPELRSAAKQALESCQSVTVSGLRDQEGSDDSLTMRLTPIQTAEHGASPRLLVSFIRSRPPALPGDPPLQAVPHVNTQAVRSREWTEAIRISHQELEASREELQALNEELRTANEQLNIANDDLNVANVQLKEKIAELEMQSRVLSAGAVMTLFLDAQHCVRWFTHEVCELFPLLPADVGRPITDFSKKFEDDFFLHDVLAVMQTDEPREAEVQADDGKWFLRRIRPYLSTDDATAGVAVTFTDVSERKREGMRESAARNEVLVRLVDALRPLFGSRETQRTATRVLREQLGAARVSFIEACGAGEFEVVATDSLAGITNMLGHRYRVGDLRPRVFADLLAGRIAWSDDIGSDPSLSGVDRIAYASLGIGAWASVPFLRSGRVNGALMVHLSAPHPWSRDELMYLRLMAEHTLAAVERTRAGEELREQNVELDRFNKVAVGRELRMIELKREVDDLRRRCGEPDLYPSAGSEDVNDDT